MITQGLPAREYQVVVANHNQPGGPAASPTPGIFALYDPPPPAACFYDFFESGASKWERGGEWDIAILPSGERALTDSPAGTYNNAIPPALTCTTHVTSAPFSLAGCPLPLLTFRHDYVIASLDMSQDMARVEISTDDGATWTALESYTGGGIFGNQVPLPLLAPLDQEAPEWTEVNWRTAEIGLSSFTGMVRLRFSLEVDQDVSDKGWVIDDVIVATGAVRTTDLQINLAHEGSDELLAGDSITYTLAITNVGPGTVDALVTGLFPTSAVTSVKSSAPCWAGDTVLCSFDDLTRTQTVTMVLTTSPFYAGALSTRATITATYPYAVDTDPSNNQSSDDVVVRRKGLIFRFLPLILRNW